jgi:hypothetical protein
VLAADSVMCHWSDGANDHHSSCAKCGK